MLETSIQIHMTGCEKKMYEMYLEHWKMGLASDNEDMLLQAAQGICCIKQQIRDRLKERGIVSICDEYDEI